MMSISVSSNGLRQPYEKVTGPLKGAVTHRWRTPRPKKSVTTKPVLQKILKRLFQPEEKDE